MTPPNETCSPDGHVGVATAVDSFGTTSVLVPQDTNANAGTAKTPHANATASVAMSATACPRRRRLRFPLGIVDPPACAVRFGPMWIGRSVTGLEQPNPRGAG